MGQTQDVAQVFLLPSQVNLTLLLCRFAQFKSKACNVFLHQSLLGFNIHMSDSLVFLLFKVIVDNLRHLKKFAHLQCLFFLL